MNQRILRSAAFVFTVAALCGWAAPAPAQAVRAVRIENRGAVPVEDSSVRAFITVQAGEAYDPVQVMQDVHRLRETGRYRQVEVEVEMGEGDGIVLVYAVSAKPRIARIRIFGADRLRADRLREALAIAIGDLADESDVDAGASRILWVYTRRGFPDTRVTAQLEEIPGEGVAEIRIEVDEGLRGRVVEYAIRGHEALDEGVLARGLLQRRFRWYKPWHWWGGGNTRYDELRVEEDRHQIRRRYLDAGYLDARVQDPEVEVTDRGRLRIALPVTEGARYTIGEIRLSGVESYPVEDVRSALGLRAGDTASLATIQRGADAVIDFYGSRGHVNVMSDPRLVPVAESVVDLDVQVVERPIAHVRDIHIRGQVITRDRVIRRELTVRPGDLYNRPRVRTSERRLQNLGYFSHVQSRILPADSADEVDLLFEVEEQRMGQAAFGVGFSSIDRVSGFFEISHGNFDLLSWPPVGDGQKIRVRGTAGTRRSDAEISFVEPYFLNQRLALGVDVFHRERQYLSRDYDQRDTGGQLSLTRQIGPFSRASVAYGLERIELRNVAEDAAPIFIEEEGARLKSALTFTVMRDTRDEFRIPTRGHRASAAFTVAGGALQGDTDLYAINLRAVQYFPLWFRHVLLIRGQAGVVEEYGRSDRVPFFDRHFLGGADTIRAFRFRDVGPREEPRENIRPAVIGGRTMALATVEYTVPVVQMIRAAAFYDVGMVWEDAYAFDSDLNSGYGVGLRLDIPMMPLRFDYAWPIQADDINDRSSGRFSFYIGYGL